jgi:transcriptional regulator
MSNFSVIARHQSDVAKMLGVTDQNAPIRELIARKLIELAQAGEWDAESLKELTLEAVQTAPQ